MKNLENCLLTRAAQYQFGAFTAIYRAATMRERCRIIFQQAARVEGIECRPA